MAFLGRTHRSAPTTINRAIRLTSCSAKGFFSHKKVSIFLLSFQKCNKKGGELVVYPVVVVV